MANKFEYFSREQMSTIEDAHDILISEMERIPMEEFEDLYGKENVNKDRDYVEELKREFEEEDSPEMKEAYEYSTMYEAVFTDLAEKGKWLGPETMIYNTSEYDDLVNGIDIVAEFSREGMFSHLGLAIDVTFSKEVKKKLIRIKKEIKSGDLAKVKYYNSERANIRGELSNIPHVIVGTDKRMIDELVGLWLQKRKLTETLETQELSPVIKKASREKLKEAGEQLKNHEVQYSALKQIEYQLEQYTDFAKNIGKNDVAKKLESGLETIKNIIKNKEFPEEDEFTEIIKKEIDNVF